MPGPTLSKEERRLVLEAAHLEVAGRKVRFHMTTDHLYYVVDRKEHKIFALSTSIPKFQKLCREVEKFWPEALEVAHAEAQQAAAKAKGPSARPVEIGEQAAVYCEPALSDIGAAGAMLPRDEGRQVHERVG